MRMATSSGRNARRSNSIGRKGWSGASVPQPRAVVGPAVISAVVAEPGSAVVAMRDLLSCSFQYAPCLHEMWPVDHFAADRQHPCVGMCLECGHDFFGVAPVLGGRFEGGVDHCDLRRVDGELAGEAFAPRGLRFTLQSVLIAKPG